MEILGGLPPLPDDLRDFENQRPAQYVGFNPTGLGRPDTREQDRALSILTASPWGGGAAVDVAYYFLSLSGADAVYRREWPERANPVIFHFFAATKTTPSGDVTAWCAAFVSWCYARSRANSKDEIGVSPGGFSYSGTPFSPEVLRLLPTGNASSGSFRCLKAVEEPSRGDLVVLANKGTRGLKCKGSGHVAFFEERVGNNRVKCIGGNQVDANSSGAVTECLVRTDSERFFSFAKLA